MNLKLIIVIAVVVVMNLICFFLMRYDKQCARQRKRRVPERVLFLSAGLFGALGGVLAMNIADIDGLFNWLEYLPSQDESLEFQDILSIDADLAGSDSRLCDV